MRQWCIKVELLVGKGPVAAGNDDVPPWDADPAKGELMTRKRSTKSPKNTNIIKAISYISYYVRKL